MSVTEINSRNVSDLLSTDGFKVVQTSTSWCSYCKTMKPIYEDLSGDTLVSKVPFFYIDRDQEASFINELGLGSKTIPRFFVAEVHEGKIKEVTELGGSQTRTELLAGIARVANQNGENLVPLTTEVPNYQEPVLDNPDGTISVAIIGSGPAGLTAAIYTSRAQIKTDLYLGRQPGGQLTTTTEIENFPGAWSTDTKLGEMGPDLMDRIRQQAEYFGANSIQGEVTAIEAVGTKEKPRFKLTDSGNKQTFYDAVIIATGASAKYLGLEGEERLVGKGYHSCATCDGFFYRNVPIAVVGGGDSAMEEANFLTKFASKVYLIHRSDEFRASKVMLDRVKKNPKVEILSFKKIKELVGEDSLEHVILEDIKSGETEKLDIEAVFVAIGHTPNSGFVKNILDMDNNNYLIPQYRVSTPYRVSKYDMATKIPGIFVAGDIEDTTYRQAITAAGDGCRAAIDCEKWLESLE
jgi:thioredoxin reductase (NADPH)